MKRSVGVPVEELFNQKNEREWADRIDGAVKHDGDKARFDLVDPVGLADIAKVFTMGAVKYGPRNYLKGRGLEPHRLLAAAHRHINAWHRGECIDDESGLPHLAHATATLLMIMEVERHRSRYRGIQKPAYDLPGTAEGRYVPVPDDTD